MSPDERLDEALEKLPREIPPERDLWPGVREAIEHAPRRASRRVAPWLALAASLLLVVAAWIALQRQPAEPPAQAPELAAAWRDYIVAAEALRRAIDAQPDALPSGTLATLETNLALIDGAIAEIQASVGAAPADPQRERALAALYKKKIDLLWTVSRLSS